MTKIEENRPSLSQVGLFKSKIIKDAITKGTLELDDNYDQYILYYYTTESETVQYGIIRLEDSKGKLKKIIRMFCKEGNKWILKKPNYGKHEAPLYNLHGLAGNKNNTVYIVEGEKCAKALNDLGLLATTSGSHTSYDSVDWSILATKKVIIWPDDDKAGINYCNAVIKKLTLLNCKLSVVDVDIFILDTPEINAGYDAADYIAAQYKPTKKAITDLKTITVNKWLERHEIANIKRKRQGNNELEKIINYIDIEYRLFHDKDGNVYTQNKKTSSIDNLINDNFISKLTRDFFNIYNNAPRMQTIKDAITIKSQAAIENSPCEIVYKHTAAIDNDYYLNLNDPINKNVIKINSEGWEIVPNKDINFINENNFYTIPDPAKNNNIDLGKLWGCLNIPKNDEILIITWLIDALRPNTPYPILQLFGEQGTAKSTTQEYLKSIIDPSSSNLSSAPKNKEELYLACQHDHIISYENISTLNEGLQDALCLVSTGSVATRRKLYTDNKQVVYKIFNPIILNGINEVIVQQDLVDRTLSIELPIIKGRLSTANIANKFKQAQPAILGALLNIFVRALKILPEIEKIPLPKRCPSRQIEFVHLGQAISQIMHGERNTFLNSYTKNRAILMDDLLQNEPVIAALLIFIEEKNESGSRYKGDYILHQLIKNRTIYGDGWPKNTRSLGQTLNRNATALRARGIDFKREKKGGDTWWTFTIEDEETEQ